MSRLLAYSKNNPLVFGVVFSTLKTSAADLLVQLQFEQKKVENIDWRRNSAFALFGCFYLGGVQYALYVPIFGRMFPKAAEFATKPIAEKLKDPRGFANMLAQVFLDQCIHHPLAYFPVFYSVKEVVAGNTVEDGLAKCEFTLTCVFYSEYADTPSYLSICTPSINHPLLLLLLLLLLLFKYNAAIALTRFSSLSLSLPPRPLAPLPHPTPNTQQTRRTGGRTSWHSGRCGCRPRCSISPSRPCGCAFPAWPPPASSGRASCPPCEAKTLRRSTPRRPPKPPSAPADSS
jgi:hypothetical protein